jgi:glycerol kinase
MGQARYVLALDQGTTGTTGMLIDAELQVRGRGYEEFRQIFPSRVGSSMIPRTSGTAPCTSSRRRSRTPASTARRRRHRHHEPARDHPALGPRDPRVPSTTPSSGSVGGPPLCDALKAGHTEVFAEDGPRPRSLLLGHQAPLDARQRRGRARAGRGAASSRSAPSTASSWRLTGGVAHVTDVSNASRTLMMDLTSLAWATICSRCSRCRARCCRRSAAAPRSTATTRGVPGLPDGIPIAGMAGDQQAALFGQACFDAGSAKCTYGTGAFCC